MPSMSLFNTKKNKNGFKKSDFQLNESKKIDGTISRERLKSDSLAPSADPNSIVNMSKETSNKLKSSW